jgi:hypothetical protein
MPQFPAGNSLLLDNEIRLDLQLLAATTSNRKTPRFGRARDFRLPIDSAGRRWRKREQRTMSQKRETHPNAALLERFMRNEADPAEKRWVIRHLIAGCAECVVVTGKLWNLGESPGSRLRPERPLSPLAPPLPLSPLASTSAASAATKRPGELTAAAALETPDEALAYGGIFARLAEMGRRLDREHSAAPQRVAELLGKPPGERLALVRQESGERDVAGNRGNAPGRQDAAGASAASRPGFQGELPEEIGARRRFLTPAVCDLLLVRSSEIAAAEPAKALGVAELARAIAENLDVAACGAAVAQSLRVRAWAYTGHARRLAGDLDGAEWALTMAESLAGGEEPLEWAELLLFRASLAADRRRLAEAEDLLERAADLFGEAPAPRRMGCTLALLGLVRAERGDTAGAIGLLRSAVNLLDQPERPADWRLTAAALCHLARLHADRRAAAAAEPETSSQDRRTTGPAGPEAAGHAEAEALQALGRARILARGAADAAAEARIGYLQGQVEAASGKPLDAERTLRTAIDCLAGQGLGREALLAQVELAQLLAHQGRAAELQSLAGQTPPRLQARDKSLNWYAARILFEHEANGAPKHLPLIAVLGQYLAPRRPWNRFPSGVENGDAGLGLVA